MYKITNISGDKTSCTLGAVGTSWSGSNIQTADVTVINKNILIDNICELADEASRTLQKFKRLRDAISGLENSTVNTSLIRTVIENEEDVTDADIVEFINSAVIEDVAIGEYNDLWSGK